MKNTANHTSLPGNELEFAYKVRRALDEKANTLPQATTDRLGAARKLAIARKKPESAIYTTVPERRLAGMLAGSGANPFNDSLNWLIRVGIITPLIVLIVGAFSIYKYEEAFRIDELANLDAAVLSDELPLTAYLDHGFDTYLNKPGE